MPRLRRIDDVVAGAPVETDGCVVTPHARRSGWALTVGPVVVFRLRARPHSLAVRESTGAEVRVMAIRDRAALVRWAPAVLVVVAMLSHRRSR